MTLQPGEKARMYALGGLARGGATRGGYVSGGAFINIGGAFPPVIIDSLTITDALDESPNTATFRVHGSVPMTGTPVRITLGSTNSGTPIFAGHVLAVNQIYAADNPINVQAEVSCTDYTWLLGFVTVTTRYRNQSASTIAADLLARYAPGFTGAGIAPNLPALDEITYTDTTLDECLTRLARRIGAYWYVDYARDVHLFFTETRNGDPVTLTPAHASLRHFSAARDRSQCLTRVYVEARGSRLLTDVPIGGTMIPLESTASFAAAADSFVKSAFQSSEGGAQRIQFTGVTTGGGGTLVGPGIGPGSPLTLKSLQGGLIESGTHDYVVRFVTGSGESLASPLTRTTLGVLPNPTTAPTNVSTQATGSPMYGTTITIGDTVRFAYSYETAGPPYGETLMGAPSQWIGVISNQDALNPTRSAPISMEVLSNPDARIAKITIYMEAASRPADGFRVALREPNYPGYAGPIHVSNDGGGYGVTPHPGSNTTGHNRIDITTIPLGQSGVTGRRLYRSAANAGQLKLLTTIADNTTTTYADNTPDASLGANMTGGDSSGLVQPAGQVVAGAVEIPIAGTFAFEAAGGWAIIGNGDQIIFYSGLEAGTKLVGIPASGPGAIVATIAYNSTITAAPMLTGIPVSGVGSIIEALETGGEIYLVVQVDDAARQAALAALVGGTGIREEWIQDRRLSAAEARARGRATLETRPLEEIRVSYDCRDLLTASGKTCTVALGPPTNMSGTFKIQHVRMHNFQPHGHAPTLSVEASSRRFSFEDWLRLMRTRE